MNKRERNKSPMNFVSIEKVNRVLAMGLLFSGTVLNGASAGAPEREERRSIVDLDPVRVVGGQEAIELIPGSAAFIDEEEIRLHGYDNIEQVIRRVPGVYFRTEDGFGLFPNISLRGVGSMRTTSVTLMEDGILSAPAPYAAPAAYYTPTTGRMAGIEMIKGSSQVKYGPHTTGGVINYLSTPIPLERGAYVRATYGENNEIRFHAYAGETVAAGDGQVGYMLENYYRSSDGFKTLDGIGNIQGSGRTGFRKNEPMFKALWTLPTTVNQSLEMKIGYTDMVADETYLGLTDEDFRADPFRRYASTMFDRIETEQVRTYLRHRIDPTPDSRLVTTGYFNQFSRAWYKLHDVNAQDGEGNINLSEALAGINDGRPLGVLRGERDGTFQVRNNNREYQSFGLQSIYQHRVEGGNLDHNLEVGIRLHEDYEDRFQHQDRYEVIANDRIRLDDARAPGSQDDRRGTARAVALHVKDTIEFDRWAVTPGLRYEHIRYINENRRAGQEATNKGSLDIFAPGIGAIYSHTDRLSFFGGVHRGFSTPAPSGATGANRVNEETSIGYELGTRYNNYNGFRTEAAFFWTDFSDLIVPDNIGGAGTRQTENAGDARVFGLELSASYDPGIAYGWQIRNPNYVAFTWTDATIRSEAAAGGGAGAAVESIFAGGEKGNRLPYVPEYQIAAGTGVEYGRWGAYLDAFFVPSTHADASNRGVQERWDEIAQAFIPDARFGKNESYVLFDVSVHYRVADSAKAFVGVQNLLNEEYVASRLPHGPRPGAPRFAHIGMEVTF